MSALYIHIPFCERKCSYCDFVSFDSLREREDDYFGALKKEIEMASESFPFKGVSSVFFGGGTPSLAKEKNILETLAAAQKWIGIKKGAEITIEANPNSLSLKKLLAYRRAGINRLSIGLQSTDDVILERIGRLHTNDMFQKAFRAARVAGFDNINVDLMYALPGQTAGGFRKTLGEVAALAPEHISAYALTLAQGTSLYDDVAAKRICLPDEEADREMYHLAVDELMAYGYARYEISNFTKKGYECAHNLAYWKREEYLGAGLAAHSCIGEVRFSNPMDLEAYISCLSRGKTAYINREQLDHKGIETEYIMLSLRLADGIDLKEYEQRFKKTFYTAYARPAARLIKAGLAETSKGCFRLTGKGFDLENSVVVELLNNL